MTLNKMRKVWRPTKKSSVAHQKAAAHRLRNTGLDPLEFTTSPFLDSLILFKKYTNAQDIVINLFLATSIMLNLSFVYKSILGSRARFASSNPR